MGCTFVQNFASDSGGAIYATSFTNLTVNQTALFQDNFAYNYGGDVYATYCDGNITLDSVDISNSNSPSSLYF